MLFKMPKSSFFFAYAMRYKSMQILQEKIEGRFFLGGREIKGKVEYYYCFAFFLIFTISCNQKCSVTFKMHQIRFSPGLCLGPRWGSSRRFLRPLVSYGGGYPLPISYPVDACGASPLVERKLALRT